LSGETRDETESWRDAIAEAAKNVSLLFERECIT